MMLMVVGTVACGGQQPPPEPEPVVEAAPARDTAAERRAAEEAARLQREAAAQRLCDDANAAFAAGNYDGARSLYQRSLSEYAGTACANGAEAQLARIAAVQTIRERIHFDFDKSRITDEAAAILQRKAEILKAHPGIKLTIEGHCDDRGSLEYNQALGQRRAESAKRYLASLGVPADSYSTVSYGEERPIAQGENEAAWAQNRRSEFVIQNIEEL